MSRNKVSTKIPTKTKDSKSKEGSTAKKNTSSIPKSDKKTSKSTTGKENTPKKAPKPKTPTPEPQEEYNYEDDFEDYSDDFEEDDEDKEEEKKVELKSENIRTEEAKPISSRTSESTSILTQPQPAPISRDESKSESIEDPDETPMMRRLKTSKGSRASALSEVEQKPMNQEERFDMNVKTSQRQLTLVPSGPIIPMNFGDNGNQQKRHQTLRQLIGIESIPVRILDKPPVKDYNLYLEMFGDSGKIQAYCQTGDDDTNEETQTDEREIQNKWTQHPAIDSFGWGADAQMGTNEMGILPDDLNLFKINHLQNPRLKEFIEASGQIIIELITSRNRKVEYIEMHHRSDLAFSAGYNLLGLGQLASVSSCQFVLKPPHEDETVLGAFYIEESPATDIVKKSVLVEFLLSNSKIPQRIFICEGKVKCCVYAPDGTVLFAGLTDGSCVAWDLLESSTTFTSSIPWPESEEEIILRTPAYDTSFLSSTFSSSSKSASTIHITTINRPNDTTYQVACLDESGTISVWSVLRDVNTTNNLGTRPDARLAMGLTALLRPDHSILNANSNPTFLIANCMVSNRKDPTHFIVGTDIGFLMTLSRTKGPTYTGPRLYKANMNVFGEVVCLRNSPFDEDVFVAGLSSGCLSLHRTNHSIPLIVLTPPQEARDIVTTIEWSPSHPSILYSVHGGTRVVTWDLGKGQQPVSISKISQINAKVICSHCWFTKPGPASSGIGYMALGHEDGSIQLHALENVKPIIDSGIKNITQILKKSGAFV